MSDHGNISDRLRRLAEKENLWSNAKKALNEQEAEIQRLRDALEEPLEPCGDFPSKLEWLAHWLDGTDSLLEILNGEPLGNDVQRDLRRWATDWRAALAGVSDGDTSG